MCCQYGNELSNKRIQNGLIEIKKLINKKWAPYKTQLNNKNVELVDNKNISNGKSIFVIKNISQLKKISLILKNVFLMMQ